MKNLIITMLKNKIYYTPLVLFVTLSVWWLYLTGLPIESTEETRQIWAALYQIMAIFGGLTGLIVLKRVGGYKSLLGRAVLALSVGLLLQSFGQSVYSYFIFYKHIEVPYPSVGDIGFFGSVVAYIWAIVILARMVGVHFSLKMNPSKVRGILISLAILLASYLFFLQGYEFDWSDKLRIFLDFGYPLGQAIYLSVAITAFLVSRDFLGGMLKKPILSLIFALVFQYFSDFTFLYQASNGTWYVGGWNDYLYFTSYFLMSMALLYIGETFDRIQSENLQNGTDSENIIVKSTNDILKQIILSIIKRQEKVAGAIAWEEAKAVHNIKILNQKNEELSIEGDAKEAVNTLVGRYKALFGELAVQVSKDAARHYTAELPKNEVPDILK